MSTRDGTKSEAGVIRALARWVFSIRTADLSPATIEQAKLLILDTIGCGLAGRREEDVAPVLEMVARLGGTPECSLIGGGRTNVLNAVLANGLLVRILDLNDYLMNIVKGQPESAGHPSDNIPIALSVGEARNAPGSEIIAAIVVGYELYARLNALMDRGGDWDGVTASGLVAPAIAGRLMGLDEERLAHALALGLARAATPRAVRSGDLSAAKNLANAQVAETGVQAALLAEHGATGPLALFEQKHGLGRLFAGDDALATLSAKLPADNCLIRANVKAYPCVATGQSSVAAAIELRRALAGAIADIASIELVMADYPIVRRQAVDPGRLDPQSKESADHSFTFITAAALLDGQLGIAQFAGERWHDPVVRALMAKITFSFDPSWSVRAPNAYPVSLIARLTDGSARRIDIPYPPGASRLGLDEAVVIDKFHDVTGAALDRRARDRLIAAAMGLDKSASPAALLDAARG